eukprot:SAG11_NODE_4681_length_1808_cov_2.149795_2_plen_109_part_00
MADKAGADLRPNLPGVDHTCWRKRGRKLVHSPKNRPRKSCIVFPTREHSAEDKRGRGINRVKADCEEVTALLIGGASSKGFAEKGRRETTGTQSGKELDCNLNIGSER